MNVQNRSRRGMLKSLAVFSALAMIPNMVFAAWPKKAFETKKISDAIDNLYGGASSESDQIKLKVPDIAENGAVVPVSVSTDIEGVKSISIYVEENPNPLSASFEIGENNVADVSTRIKMGKTSKVIAAVHAGDNVYTTGQEVKVTIGGCGG